MRSTSPYKYCNYVTEPNLFVISIGVITVGVNVMKRNRGGGVTSVLLLLSYLVYNRIDLANISPVLNESYLARNDILSLIMCFALLAVYSPTAPRLKCTKMAMLIIYACISIALSVIGIIETVQLGELSKRHQTVSSTGKILIDTSIFDVRRGEVLFGLFVYWKLICQLVFAQITIRIPDICEGIQKMCVRYTSYTCLRFPIL